MPLASVDDTLRDVSFGGFRRDITAGGVHIPEVVSTHINSINA